jgi:F0F1-type ATP synthase beta subunit
MSVFHEDFSEVASHVEQILQKYKFLEDVVRDEFLNT